MTKRLLALMMALMLMLSFTGNPALAQEETKALPEVGSVVEGFKVLQHAPYPLLEATCVLMEHEKTKAKLVYAACGDTDRAFSITFRTFAPNDKGIPHVFEHSTLSGNEKYPDPSLFFTMMSQTYNTYLNAATHPTSTTFQCSSLSEKQLFATMDYMLSGVFHPTILTDERAMMREAYRYELTGKDEPITVVGTVFSEMQGALTMTNQAFFDIRKTLYPGSERSMVAGGDPAVIPDMTWQEIKDFHDAYYHPSNSVILLYGDIDAVPFLRKINEEFLSDYEFKEVSIEDEGYTPYEGYREESFTFPSADGDSGQPMIIYGFSLDGATQEDCELLSLAADALSMEGSSFIKALRQKLPEAMGGVAIDQDTIEPTMAFIAMNADESKKDVFKGVVDKVVADALKDGLDMGQIEGLCNQRYFASLASLEQDNRGVDLSTEITQTWGFTDDPFAFLKSAQLVLALDEYVAKDAFNEAFRKYLTNPPRSALITMTTDQGGIERNAAALEQSLAERKAAMTDEEIEALIKRTEDFAQWTQDNAKSSMIDQVKVVNAADLPEKVVRYEAKVEDRNGLKVVTSEVDNDELVLVKLSLDASAIPFEMLHEYVLYTATMFFMPTENYKQAALLREATNLLLNPSITADILEFEDGSSRPEMVVSWVSTKENLEKSFQLIEEVLFRTDLNSTPYLNQLLSSSVAGAYYSMMEKPETLALTLATALINKDVDYADYMSGMGMYHFLTEKCVDLQKPQLTAMLSTVQAIRSILLNKRDAYVVLVGGKEGVEEAAVHAEKLYSMLGNVEYPIVDYSAKLPKRVEPLGMDIGGTMQFNIQAMLLEDTGFEESGKMMAMKALVLDKLLLPVLRFENSAYGVFNEMGDPFVYIQAYRDPNLGKTYEFYGQIGKRLRDMEFTQEDLEGYIVSSYSTLATPYGPISGGYIAAQDALTGDDTFEKLERKMREIKAFSPTDVAAYSAIYDILAEKGVKVTVGGSRAIEAEKDMFAAVDKTLVR